jgi:tetratricopeptide (TPR) repeat protein
VTTLLLVAGGLAGLAVALFARAHPRRMPGGDGADEERELARRELAGLREQLAEGELAQADYRRLRERLAVRLAARSQPATVRAVRPRAGLWLVGFAAALAVAVLLVLPALRGRAPGGGPTGNDFIAAGAAPGPAQRAAMPMTAARLAALLRRASALDHAGKPGQAVPIYRMGVAFLPSRADLRAALGFALARSGRPAEAELQLREAVGQAPRLGAARLYLGAVLLREGKRREARVQLQRYLALDPRGEAVLLVRRLLAVSARR